MPRQFSTPMFWKEEDLNELEGTDIVAKIGKEDAEATYARDVKPFVEVNTNFKEYIGIWTDTRGRNTRISLIKMYITLNCTIHVVL